MVATAEWSDRGHIETEGTLIMLTNNLLTRGWWMSWWAPPPLQDNPEYQAADEWTLDYMPTDKEVYEPVLHFAERQYDQMVKLAENLDKKADDLMRTAGTIGAALLTAATLLLGSGRATLVLPAVVCLVLVVIAAARIRGPVALTVPMSARDLLNVADHELIRTANQVEGAAAASLNFATVGMKLAVDWKAGQLRRATALFCISLVLLIALIL